MRSVMTIKAKREKIEAKRGRLAAKIAAMQKKIEKKKGGEQ